MPRSTGNITDAILLANEIEFWSFIKLNFAAPTGTLFLTDRPGGYTGVIGDNVSTTWVETDFEKSPLTQSMQDIFVVNWIQFANINFDWINRVYQQPFRNVVITIYEAWWDTSTTPSTFKDSYISFKGRLDDGEHEDVSRLAIKPHHTPWEQEVPNAVIGSRCINDYRNPEDCQYTGAEPVGQTTCGKTRSDCRLRGNEININIYDDLPKQGETVMYGGLRHGLQPAPQLRK